MILRRNFPCTSTSRFLDARDNSCIYRKHSMAGAVVLRCGFSYCEIAWKASCDMERAFIIGQNDQEKFLASKILHRVCWEQDAYNQSELSQSFSRSRSYCLQCRPCFGFTIQHVKDTKFCLKCDLISSHTCPRRGYKVRPMALKIAFRNSRQQSTHLIHRLKTNEKQTTG